MDEVNTGVGVLDDATVRGVTASVHMGEASSSILCRFNNDRRPSISCIRNSEHTTIFNIQQRANHLFQATAATYTFFYAMVKYPEVQRRGQQEIENLLRSTRLPTYEDRSSLPYIEAVYREVLRWRPPLPITFPHNALEDDSYKGYFIPKGKLSKL